MRYLKNNYLKPQITLNSMSTVTKTVLVINKKVRHLLTLLLQLWSLSITCASPILVICNMA